MNNYYELVPEHNSYYNDPNSTVKHPARVLIIGSSGSGKTNTILNLNNKMNCFHKYYLFIKMLGNDPLYDHVWIPHLKEVEEKYQNEGYGNVLEIESNTLDDLPDINDETIDPNYQNLFVFDDMLDESNKDLKKITAYFTKMRINNCSLVFIGQDYFKIPPVVRRNTDTIMITQITSIKDLRQIYQDVNLGETFDEFKEIVQTACNKNKIFVKHKNKYYVNFFEGY